MSKVINSVMEKSNKSHGKKSDKETHTPMLKIFKDMMQLEKNDPEKANLLKEKERHKKKKQYSSSRTKTDHIINRSDSSSSDINGDCQPIIETRHYDVHRCNTEKSKDKKISEDTSSCRSCALKRLATSEYACLICLGIVFAITIVVAFFMVFKSSSGPVCKPTMPHRGLKILKGLNWGDSSLKDSLDDDRNEWDDSLSGRYGDMSGFPDIDDTASRGLNYGAANTQFTDLSRIIDINKLNYGKSSERLKSFYKKLVQTDDQIKNLKKGFLDSSITNLKNSERIKRSLNHNRFRSNEGCNNNDDGNNRRRNKKHKRGKRNDSLPSPISFEMENEKMIVQINTPIGGTRKVAKCSHAPKESKSHEKELKHPFYKHSQRLDELLDKLLDSNVQNIISNPLDIFRDEEVKSTTAKSTTRKATTHKATTHKATTHKATTHKATTRKKNLKNVAVMHHPVTHPSSNYFKVTTNSKTGSKVLLGVTTILSSPHLPTTLFQERPNIRKLMQVYEQDEEILGYEDFKEVLTDDVQSPEDPEIKLDRAKRRLNTNTESNPAQDYSRSNPSAVAIPNWKGPLPLYPDELNTMVKQDVSKPLAKGVKTANVPLVNDIQYVEDYLSNKYEKLAQAYSDYGVLEAKKPSKTDESKNDKVNVENRVKLSVDDDEKDNHFRIIRTTTPRMRETIFEEYKIPDYTIPDEANREGIMFGFKTETTKSKRVHRAVKAQHKESNKSLANSVTINTRTLKSLNALPKLLSKDVLTIQVGTEEDTKSGDNTLVTVGYSLGRDSTEIRFQNTSPTRSTTAKHFFEDVTLKQRSLKSITDTENESVIALRDNITIDDSTPLISVDDKVWTNKKISLMDEDIEINDNQEVSTNNMSEYLVTKVPDYEDYDAVKHSDGNSSLDKVLLANFSEKLLNESGRGSKLNTGAKKSIIDAVNSINDRNNTNKTYDGMDLSDLFRMFSTWFSSLASASLNSNDDQSETNSSIMFIKPSETPDRVTADSKNTTDIVYPNYDSDMIDNIGHRSRVLMSVDEASNTTNKYSESDNEIVNTDPPIINSTELKAILTTLKYERDAHTLEGDKRDTENKTVVKRSLSDSGLVFWSDLYDDEYGIKVDQVDEVNGKNPRKGMEFMKRSKNWIQDKVKNIAENIKDLHSDGMKRETYDESRTKVFKRHATHSTDDTPEKVTSFAELKVKMRNVCKEAAKAVQQTRKMKVRESQEDSQANSIMQQLVRMMSDLVDYQVKQKTCLKLPADLQNFLEWLTIPEQDQNRRQSNQDLGFLDEHSGFAKDKDFNSPSGADEKSEYLDSLRSVEELIHQFGQMNNEDKSKMSGVRQYLENQQDYLTKQIAILDELHFSNLYGNQQPMRVRRHIATENTPKFKRNRVKKRLKRRFGNFLKNLVKKSTTDNNDDAIENNDENDKENNDMNNFVYENNNRNVKSQIQDFNDRNTDFDSVAGENRYSLDRDLNDDRVDDLKMNKDGNSDGMMKRNLQDVYYRALNEAKKVTTEKNVERTNDKLF